MRSYVACVAYLVVHMRVDGLIRRFLIRSITLITTQHLGGENEIPNFVFL